MPIGDRIRRWRDGEHKRLVRDGDTFTSDELERGEIELDLPEPTQEPHEERAEPWATDDPAARERLRLYQEFIASRREADPDYGDD